MIYLWVLPENYKRKFIAVYDFEISPSSFLLYHGKKLEVEEFQRCNLYVRSIPIELPDDPFLRMQLRPPMHSAYIFTPEGMFYFNGSGMVRTIKINEKELIKLKNFLSISNVDQNTPPKALSDEQLQVINAVVGERFQFHRVPILKLERALKCEIQTKYDCIDNNGTSPLVNEKVMELLLSLAPDDVQFFDAEIRCKDGILNNYKLVNITHTIQGIDHEKSVPGALGFKYLTYKPGCMGKHKLARDEEYLGNILVTEGIKQAFEKEKITGVGLVRPEDYYRPITPADIIAANAEEDEE